MNRSFISRGTFLLTLAVTGPACVDLPDQNLSESTPTPVEAVASQLQGENLVGMNLVGMNLVGMNLASTNLVGMNLGGTNLVGMNLVGMNLTGTNLGGNNLGGQNLGGSNLVGMNLVGMNLVGMNLVGMNLGGSNLAGSNVAGTNLVGMNLVGMNLVGMNLASASTGSNLHNLGLVSGMLYSGEDVWQPKTSQRIVMGLGSIAFAKLMAEQSPGARISAAVGKLPWGFATVAGGPLALEAWEAIIWGDKSYNVFVLVAPVGSNWMGVAGYVKAIFRWNAPPTQLIDISGIDASAPHDPTLRTDVLTYTGMMNAGPKVLDGTITAKDFMAGELAFVTATTNNQTVRVDFSAWIKDAGNNSLVLANVEPVDPPTYAEGAYNVFANADGTMGVAVAEVVVPTTSSSLVSSFSDVRNSYESYLRGWGPKPTPIRCSGALYLNQVFGEPVPVGKCDSGLTFVPVGGGYPQGLKTWIDVPGAPAPMNQHMLRAGAGETFLRRANQPILSETYIFMWEPNHTLPAAAVAGSTGQDRTSLGVAVASVASCLPSDVPDNAFSNVNTLKWCGSGTPSASAPRSLMYMWSRGIPITSYRITAAVDFATRDPKSWTFQGCTGTCAVGSDTGWVTLDTRSNQTFTVRGQSKDFSFGNTTAYQQYRLRITANAGNTTATQIEEVQMFDSGGAVLTPAGLDRTENGVISWTGVACSQSEGPARAFDNLLASTGATRWCVRGVPSASRPAAVAYGWSAGQVVTSYRVTSASDLPARDPRSWSLQACDGTCRAGVDTGWVTLDSRSGETFASRHLTKAFSFSNTVAYPQYRLRVTANNGDTSATQVGELQLF
jgi:hypothetical protein